MSEDTENNKFENDRQLDSLLRLAREQSKGQFRRPSDELIIAYVMDTASEDQKSIVRHALSLSPEFRKEIRDLIADVDKLQDQHDTVNSSTTIDGAIPDRELFISRHENISGRKTEITDVWQWLVKYKIPQVWAPIAAIAAVLLLLIRPIITSPPVTAHLVVRPQLTIQDLDPAYLVKQHIRSRDVAPPEKDFATAQGAALSEFRKHLIFQSGGFQFLDTLTAYFTGGPANGILLRFLADSITIVSQFQIHVPDSIKRETAELQVWIVTLPERNLLRIDSIADTTDIIWENSRGQQGCVALTAHFGSVFVPVAGGYFQLRRQTR
jgi:hypothetical protein